MTTIWTVYQDYLHGPRLVSVEAKVTSKQAKLSERYAAFSFISIIPIERVHLTPAAAIAAWQDERATEVEECRRKLDAALARQALKIEGAS